jgi:hypothetical protein
MFSIPGHKGNADQSNIGTLPHSSQNGYHQEQKHKYQMFARMPGEGDRKELIHTVGRNVN